MLNFPPAVRIWLGAAPVDLRKFFDNLDHELVMKAVRHHDKTPWVLLYSERWPKAPVQRQDGSREERTKGSPQGAVVSPFVGVSHGKGTRWSCVRRLRVVSAGRS